MLVPSTFTGWYRKMMIKAEIASEIIRSRIHTPIPVGTRTGGGVPSVDGTPADGVDDAVSPTELGSENVPGMLSYCIQDRLHGSGLISRRRLGRTWLSSHTYG